MEFLDDPEEKAEVDDLLNWWNWYDIISLIYIYCAADVVRDSQVFPSHVKRTHQEKPHLTINDNAWSLLGLSKFTTIVV